MQRILMIVVMVAIATAGYAKGDREVNYLQEAGLSDAQIEQLQALSDGHHDRQQELKVEVRDIEVDLDRLLLEEEPDTSLIEAKVAESANLSGDLRLNQIKLGIDARTIVGEELWNSRTFRRFRRGSHKDKYHCEGRHKDRHGDRHHRNGDRGF